MVRHIPAHPARPDPADTHSAAPRRPEHAEPPTRLGPEERLTALQRTAGNRAVARVIAGSGPVTQRQPPIAPPQTSPIVTSGVDPLTQSITADQARTMSDSEIARSMTQLEAVVAVPASFMTSLGAQHNLRVLWGERNRRRPDAGRMPAGGEAVGKAGLVSWHGEPELRLRTHPDVNDETNIIQTLPFNSRVQVIKRFPDWYFVSTTGGDTGYAASKHVSTDAPEPAARLHTVEPGIPGTAIAIAERYYGDKSDNWGQDLRFYVNVLAWANKISVPDSTSGWKSVHFQAGQTIWIPSQPFAMTLKGVVNSGSYSYNAADFLGIADIIERIAELFEDFGRAIERSGQYIPEAIARHVDEMLQEVLVGLAKMMAMAAGLLAVTTAIGAAIGNAPGAAAGFEVGVALLEWLGLGMLVMWIAQSVMVVGASFADFFGKVWNARGDNEKIDKAARQFAESIGLLMAKILEGLIMYVTAKGLPAAIKSLRGTKLGSGRTAEWLSQRTANVAAGTSPLPSPQTVFGGPRAGAQVPAVPAEVTVVDNIGAFRTVPEARLAPNLPSGHFWSRNGAGEWVIMREPGATAVPLELTVYSDGVTVNYVLRGNGQMIASDAMAVPSGYSGPRLPRDLRGSGANSPYIEPTTGTLYDKSHGVDYAHTLEGPGVRNSSMDPANFTPASSAWNRGARNILAQQITARGGGYRELPIFDANPLRTVNGSPIPREFVFVETNSAGVPQQAWRVPNDPALTDRTLGALSGRDIPLAQVPEAALRPGAPLVPDAPGVTYLPGVVVGQKGKDEK